MSLTDSLVSQYRRWRYRQRPEPAIDVRLAWSVPGWMVRVAAGTAMGSCLGLAAVGSGAGIKLTLALIVVAAVPTLVVPRYQIALAVIILAALIVMISPNSPVNPVAVGVSTTGYIGLRVTMAAELLPWRSRAELAALIGWRDLVVLGLTGLLLLVSFLPGGGWWTLPLGVIGLVSAVMAYVVGSQGVRNARTGALH